MTMFLIMVVAFCITILIYNCFVQVFEKLLKSKSYCITYRGKIIIGSVLCCVVGFISGVLYVHYFI